MLVKGDPQPVAQLRLQKITPEKAQPAPIRDAVFTADRVFTRLDANETRTSNLNVFAHKASEFGVMLSHSVFCLTVEEEVQVE